MSQTGVYVLNMPKLKDLSLALGDILNSIGGENGSLSDALKELLERIEQNNTTSESMKGLFDNLLEQLKNADDETKIILEGLLEQLESLTQNSNLSAQGRQKAKGQYLQIPAIEGTYQIKWVFEEDIYITGIRYSQSAWKYQDNWSLYIDEETIYETVFTKEVGEYKHFNRFELVKAGTEITFELSNNSGNSRDLWADLEYLDTGEKTTETADVVAKSEVVWLEIWDSGMEDNDTIDVYLNGTLVIEEFVCFNKPERVKIEGLVKGNNILRFEGKNSDMTGIACTVHIYEKDGKTKIINQQTQTELFLVSIDVPKQGRQVEPFPFLEWEVYRI